MATFIERPSRRLVDAGTPHERIVYTPGTIRCSCNHAVPLDSTWANTCLGCGTEYNGSGQRLAPRSQWGEETGERF